MRVEYKEDDVLVAATRRIAEVFERFERIVVSVSGGKDSTVMLDLVLREAERRDRSVQLFFLDQEAEYESTIALMRQWMALPRVTPVWYQSPLELTNATSHSAPVMRAWWPGDEWMRPRESSALVSPAEAPRRFYKFFDWYEAQHPAGTAFFVGLRSRESFNRFRAVTNSPGYEGVHWSTRTKSEGVFRFYPLYDWASPDVWRYIVEQGLDYNRHYDRFYAKHGYNKRRMRVSNLIHEKSFRCLADLQEFEPDTYDRLVRRLCGVHSAALYASDPDGIYSATVLPPTFSTWLEWRDYLLDTTPSEHRERYKKRFARQPPSEGVHRDQVLQILINDYENNVPVKRHDLRAIWWDRL